MSARVYMLLDILEDKYAYALQILKTIAGVVIADTLEGHPNTLVILEAPDRQRLVELMMPVLGSVDHVTEDVHLLVSQAESPAVRFTDPVGAKPAWQLAMNLGSRPEILSDMIGAAPILLPQGYSRS